MTNGFSKYKLLGRVLLSSGVEVVNTLNSTSTLPNTYSPREDWRKITDEELDSLIESKMQNDLFHILKIPIEIIKSFEEIGFKNAKNQDEISKITNKLSYIKFTNLIKQFSDELTDNNNRTIIHNPVITDGNLRSTSFNNRTMTYMGLHIDTFDSSRVEKRDLLRNRICINFSEESRNLIMINLNSQQILNKLKNVLFEQNIKIYYIDELYQLFFNHFPNYPVMKIEVKPNEAYFAPTEDVIHDGNTLGNKKKDLRLTLRGFFNNTKIKSYDTH